MRGMIIVLYNFQVHCMFGHCDYKTFVFYSDLPIRYSKCPPPGLAAELSPLPCVPGHAPDLVLSQVCREFLDNDFQLLNS